MSTLLEGLKAGKMETLVGGHGSTCSIQPLESGLTLIFRPLGIDSGRPRLQKVAVLCALAGVGLTGSRSTVFMVREVECCLGLEIAIRMNTTSDVNEI
eukprot:m.117589 g.117589  ORF g.117589 m.117589 type:complete len:98 (+) comp21703_c0_seq5:2483-2776(+)